MKIAIAGCGGRMGRTLVKEVLETDGCIVVGGTNTPGSPAVGRDMGEVAGVGPLGIAVSAAPRPLFESAEAVLDFTAPEASAAHASLAGETKTILVVGTTGLEPEHEAVLTAAARETVIVRAPNMSLAVNLLIRLTRQVAAILDDSFDIEIVDMHHRHKKDAPSGTALALARAAAKGRGVELEDVSDRARDGITGPRQRGHIGLVALRGGDVAGDHTVIFAADGERLDLAHRATSRQAYARGAVRAALWARGRPPGLYGMDDVLGLKG